MMTRRQFGIGTAALMMARPGRAADWPTELRRRLEAMAAKLTKRVKPWRGPALVVRPNGRDGAAIQAAIESVASAGGGTVLLAEGDYVSGTIDLRSHVRLEIAKDSRLLASLDLADFPARVARRPTVMDSNMHMNQSLIFAEGCENIALAGEGIIDGRGDHFPGAEGSHDTPGRPFLIRVLDCQDVHVSGLTLRDAACWLQDYLNCDRLLIEGLTVDNQANFNNDGCDIDGCRDVIVRNCLINAEDDGLCFKQASERPTERVLVENCRIYSTCNALKLGTDTQSSCRDVLVRHVELGGPDESMRAVRRRRALSAISWESVDGGTSEDALFTDIRIVRTDTPLFLRLGDRGRVMPDQPRPPAGVIRRLVFDRLTGEDNGAHGSYFMGLPDHPIRDIVLRHVDLAVGGTAEPARDQTTIAEMPDQYPDAPMVKGALPAYGLWARHMDGLSLEKVRFRPDQPDPRPMIKADFDVRGLRRD